MNKSIFEKVTQRLKEKDLKYSVSDDVIHLDMGMGGSIGTLHLVIDVKDDVVVSYAVLANQATEEQYATVAEYLHRANYGILRGNFEMDFDDGEIRYKMTTEITDARNIPNKLVDMLIVIPCLMFRRYGGGVLKLILGVGEPKELIAEAEKT